MTEGNFQTCLNATLLQECPNPNDLADQRNFSDDPDDPGGATFCGIEQTEYDVWRKHNKLPVQDVRKMSLTERTTIYHESYWEPHSPILASGLDMQMFDTSVNQGPLAAIEILQDALNVTSDGKWGPVTQKAALQAQIEPTIQRFTACRLARYARTRNYARYKTDWDRRAEQIGALALKLAKSTSVTSVTEASKAASISETLEVSSGQPAAGEETPLERVEDLVKDILK